MFAAPRSTVIAGATGSVRALVERWSAAGIPARMVAADFASHCALTGPPADELRGLLDDIAPKRPTLPFYSTVLADPRSVPAFDAAYWADNMRCPVRAIAATTALFEDGHRLFVELSPHPVAKYPVTATLDDLGVVDPCVLPALRRGQDGPAAVAAAIAALHCAGHPVDWNDLCAAGSLADVPPTAWSRQHHLIDLTAAGPRGVADGPQAVAAAVQDDLPHAREIRAELLAAPSLAARQALAEEHVAGRLRALLRLRARRIDPAARFSDLGLDSLHAVRLRNDLQSTLEIAIPLEAIWSNASARALGAFLAAQVDDGAAVRDVAAAAPAIATGGEARFVDLPAGRFRYLRWGRAGLPQAVLLHANAGSAASWARVGAALAGDFEVFALDLRGHGASRPARADPSGCARRPTTSSTSSGHSSSTARCSSAIPGAPRWPSCSPAARSPQASHRACRASCSKTRRRRCPRTRSTTACRACSPRSR